MTDVLTNDDVEVLDAIVAETIEPIAPPPELRRRIVDAIRGVDGVLYLRGCHTRAGPYPYCRHMRHGVFSVTKSLGAAVTLLRLAQ